MPGTMASGGLTSFPRQVDEQNVKQRTYYKTVRKTKTYVLCCRCVCIQLKEKYQLSSITLLCNYVKLYMTAHVFNVNSPTCEKEKEIRSNLYSVK